MAASMLRVRGEEHSYELRQNSLGWIEVSDGRDIRYIDPDKLFKVIDANNDGIQR